MDPFWGVCSGPDVRFGRWDRDAFFLSGEREIDALMASLEPLGMPALRERALDFGCGVGRLTRALAARFDHVYGIDVSQPMIALAQQLNEDCEGCQFITNTENRLASVPDAHVDLVYSRIVLQHLGNRRLIKTYIAELLRTVRRDGIFVFQVITHIPLWRRVQVRHRAYTALRRLGLPRELLYERLRLMPFTATPIPEREVLECVKKAGGRVLRVDSEAGGRSGVESRVFFVVHES